MGLCGRLAGVVFNAVNAARERTGDEFLISIQAVADVVTAPVESNVESKRKTHEVLQDALAVGLDSGGLDSRGGVGWCQFNQGLTLVHFSA